MKKALFIILLSTVLLFGLVSCDSASPPPNDGDYHDGYVEGYSKGIEEAQRQISSYVEYDFNEISSDNEKERGISIEDALQILRNYADGEPTTEAELHKAIWSINDFYYGTCDIVYGIQDYTVD